MGIEQGYTYPAAQKGVTVALKNRGEAASKIDNRAFDLVPGVCIVTEPLPHPRLHDHHWNDEAQKRHRRTCQRDRVVQLVGRHACG